MSLCDRSIASEPFDAVVVWTQADETARAKAQQRPAPVRLRDEPMVEARALVYRCLEMHPDLTRADVAVVTGLSIDTAYAAIRWLADRGQISQRGLRSHNTDPVRWSVTR